MYEIINYTFTISLCLTKSAQVNQRLSCHDRKWRMRVYIVYGQEKKKSHERDTPVDFITRGRKVLD